MLEKFALLKMASCSALTVTTFCGARFERTSFGRVSFFLGAIFGRAAGAARFGMTDLSTKLSTKQGPRIERAIAQQVTAYTLIRTRSASVVPSGETLHRNEG